MGCGKSKDADKFIRFEAEKTGVADADDLFDKIKIIANILEAVREKVEDGKAKAIHLVGANLIKDETRWWPATV